MMTRKTYNLTVPKDLNSPEFSLEFVDWLKKGEHMNISFILKSYQNPQMAKCFLERSFTSTYRNGDGEELREIAPAIVFAAKHGQLKLVSMFIKLFNVDVNQPGCIAFDGYIIEDATALWCAAGAGHIHIVECLVQAGAALNKTTKTSSTPLRAACFDGRLDIVHYLVEHGADCNIANIYHNTCLMIACYRGHFEVAKFLLDHNMEPNRQAQCGATALLFAAESGHVNIAQLLVEKGGQLVENHHGVDPLYIAAEFGQMAIVSFLTDPERCLLEVPRERAANAFELLGAHIINDRDQRDMASGYEMLATGMMMREIEACVPKVLQPRQKAYGGRLEATSMMELQEIQYNFEALEMEALIVRERVLGSDYVDLTGPIVYQGAVYADQGRFSRSLDLWLYALELKRRRNVPVFRDLLRHSQLLSQMMSMGITFDYDVVVELLKCAMNELDREQMRSSSRVVREETEAWNVGVHNLAYLMALSCQVLMTDANEADFRGLVYEIVKCDFRLRTGATLLHMACDQDTKVDYFHIMNAIRFPSAYLAKLLLQCGANPNHVDVERNTPLHCVARCERSVELDVLQSLVGNLLHYGAHPDAANIAGQTAYSLDKEFQLEGISLIGYGPTVIRFHVPVRRLECLAADAVVNAIRVLKLDIDAETLPEVVVETIRLHR